MSLTGLGITSDDQLYTIAKQMGLPSIQYIGFAEDMDHIPNGLSIINLGDHYRSGTHWTMLWSTPHGLTYFDSYGVGPEDSIIRLANGKQIVYNTKQVQRYEEEFCGIWALLAAKAISESKKEPIDAINDFANRYEAV